MKFDSNWQPLRNEDAQTALVFGFLRHAPTALALDPWLTETLGVDARGEALTPVSFWPHYPAQDPGQTYTEPDLVVKADDGKPVLVVVEAKPTHGGHTGEQLRREAVDVASRGAPTRVVVVLVGADLGPPVELGAWEESARAATHEAGLSEVAVEFKYSSWARLGGVIQRAAQSDPAWAAYADDVRSKLQALGVLGYNGGPMLDGLEGLTVYNALEVYNRAIRAARQLALAVHHQPRLQRAGFEPWGRHDLMRDGQSVALPGHEGTFAANVIVVPYLKPDWPDGAGVFLGVWLTGEDGPCIESGAFDTQARRGELPWQFAECEPTDALSSGSLGRTDRSVLEHRATSYSAEWAYAERRWPPGAPEEDVEWVLDGFEAGAGAWDG
ncbi:MAG: hypothetical protein M3459_08590 [Actinomycetota bacterium]|nr:hypothetical protein [Actinomycetota bacterium]